MAASVQQFVGEVDPNKDRLEEPHLPSSHLPIRLSPVGLKSGVVASSLVVKALVLAGLLQREKPLVWKAKPSRVLITDAIPCLVTHMLDP